MPSSPLGVYKSLLNLDLGIETCFFEGLDIYIYTWFQYLFPLYLWVLIGLIILLCRHSSTFSRMFGSNPVAVLSTLVLLSYTKILRTIIASLSFTSLEYPDGTNIYVWLYNGEAVSYTHLTLPTIYSV